MLKTSGLIKKGQWTTICCHHDLHQAEKDESIEEDFPVHVWDSKEQALEEIKTWFPNGELD